MADEVTSPEIASIAARVLAGGDYTPEDVRKLAASCLTQAVGRNWLDGDDRRNGR